MTPGKEKAHEYPITHRLGMKYLSYFEYIKNKEFKQWTDLESLKQKK